MIGERGVFIPFSRKQGAALRQWAVWDSNQLLFVGKTRNVTRTFFDEIL
jgi:hypothetical protein